jgi:hypothetical protein
MEYLLLQLRDAGPGSERNAAPPQLHMANGALFAFNRVGLIQEDAARELRERIREAGTDFVETLKADSERWTAVVAPRPPQIEHATVEDVLEDQLLHVEMEIRGAATQGRVLYPWDTRSLGVANALVRALVELGVLPELEERKWTEKLKRAADPHAEPIRTAHTLARSGVPVESRPAAGVPDTEFPLAHPAPRCSRKTLLDVFLVRQGPSDGYRLEFIEVYTDGFVIDWSGPPIRHHRHGSSYVTRTSPEARATDDLATLFLPGGGGGGGSTDERSRGQQLFAPAIPRAATELHVSLDDDGFAITLPSQTGA